MLLMGLFALAGIGGGMLLNSVAHAQGSISGLTAAAHPAAVPAACLPPPGPFRVYLPINYSLLGPGSPAVARPVAADCPTPTPTQGAAEPTPTTPSATATTSATPTTTPTPTVTSTPPPNNHAPVTANDSYSLNEDASLTRAAPGVLANDSDADGDAITAVLVSNPAHSSAFTLNADGSFSYTPAANFNGADSFTYKAQDSKGAQSTAATVAITVKAANDPPVLGNIETTALNYTEGDAPTAVSSSITVSDIDSANLSGATVGISAGYQNGEDLLSYTAPAGSSITGSFNAATGVLTLSGSASPANYQTVLRAVKYSNTSDTPDASKTISFQVDDGAAANNLSNTISRQVAITAVNDAPVNTVPAGQTVNEDTDLTFSTANGNAIAVADVDAGTNAIKLSLDVAHGTLTFASTSGLTFVDGTSNGAAAAHVTGTLANVNAALNGLKYKGVLNYNSTRGGETLTVVANDQGNTGTGGPLSDTDSVGITVNAVNDKPVAQAKTFAAQANMKITGLGGLLSGASDPDTGDANYTASLTVVDVVADNCTDCTISNLNTTAGTFDFDPPPGGTGSYTLKYRISDSGNPAPAATSDYTSITISVSGPVIWFVNPNATTNGDGRLSSPFKYLSGQAGTKDDADDVDAANHRIFVYSGTATAGIPLNSGEWLIGQGVTGTSFDALMGITPPTGVIARPSINGTRPTIQGQVTMTGNSVVRGLNIQPVSGTSGLTASGATSLTVSEVSVTTANAPAVSLTNSDGVFSFTRIDANGGSNGIVWNNASPATGSFTVAGSGTAGSGGTIQSTTSHGISLANARSVALDRMNIQNIGRNGIDGTLVVDFSFTNGTISTVGTAAAGEYEENGIAFVDKAAPFDQSSVSGNVTFTGSTITGPPRNAIYIYNWAGTISSLNISNNTLSGGTTASVADAIKVITGGSATTTANLTTATVQNNTISGFRFFDSTAGKYIGGSGISMSGGSGTTSNSAAATFGTSGSPITITGNKISDMGSNAIAASFNGVAGSSYINISNNGTQAQPMNNVEGLGISVLFAGGNTFVGSATIDNNWLDTNGPTVRAGSAGMAVQLESIDSVAANNTPQATFNVTNNHVLQPDGNGIRVFIRNSNATGNVKVQNNVVGAPFAANRNGIRVDAGNSLGDVTLCLNISGNTSAGSGVNKGIGLRKQGTAPDVNQFGINGLSPSPANQTQTATYVSGLNPAGNGVDIINGDNFVTCSLP
jgi:VCBS repeat-containing protein